MKSQTNRPLETHTRKIYELFVRTDRQSVGPMIVLVPVGRPTGTSLSTIPLASPLEAVRKPHHELRAVIALGDGTDPDRTTSNLSNDQDIKLTDHLPQQQQQRRSCLLPRPLSSSKTNHAAITSCSSEPTYSRSTKLQNSDMI
jgi:hypothetical protein